MTDIRFKTAAEVIEAVIRATMKESAKWFGIARDFKQQGGDTASWQIAETIEHVAGDMEGVILRAIGVVDGEEPTRPAIPLVEGGAS